MVRGMKQKIETPRILILSQRNLTQIQPFRCAHFEFEDVISQIDAVDILTPRFDPSTQRQAIAKKIAYHTPFRLNPGMPHEEIEREYDLFLAICGDPTDLLRVHALKGWRKKCKKAICLIDEVWVKQMNSYRGFLSLLKEFDTVILYYSQSIDPLNKMIGQKCVFMPPGVDAVRFCPYPNPYERVIDVYSVGRRSASTHHTLLRMAAEEGAFYLHDSTSASQVLNPIEHRNLFANIVKRSRYFIVNPGLIDRPDVRGDQIEFGNRYFEGAAAGTVMLGERPRNGQFEKYFDWPDAMIDVPYNSPNIDDVIAVLNRDPERQEKARRKNVEQTLLRHDWAYRWETMLAMAGLEALPQLSERKVFLQKLAKLALPIHTNSQVEADADVPCIQ